MSKKKFPLSGGIVFSTDPAFKHEEESQPTETLSPAQQRLMVSLDKRQRAGKAVTLIGGFDGRTDDLEILGKQLKNHCGAGGSTKDGWVIVQGDHRDKIVLWLQANGYTKTKRQ